MRHYRITWESPYDKPGGRIRTLTMRAKSKKEAEKLHAKLFPVAWREIKAIP